MNTDKNKQMHIMVHLTSGQGQEPGGWRWPGEDKTAFINENVYIKAAQLAEKAKLDAYFITEFPSISADITKNPQGSSLDPIVLMALIAK